MHYMVVHPDAGMLQARSVVSGKRQVAGGHDDDLLAGEAAASWSAAQGIFDGGDRSRVAGATSG
jgi:hypothetical protein